MKIFSHLLALALITPISAVASDWKYIVDGADGSLWFGRNVRNHEGLTFIQVKTEDHPNGRNGDVHAWTDVYNCEDQTTKSRKEREMVPVKMETTDGYIYNHACNK